MINRKQYKEIKKYDRQEMENLLEQTYRNGFRAGAESASNADFKIKLVQLLDRSPGVGEKITRNIINTLRAMDREVVE